MLSHVRTKKAPRSLIHMNEEISMRDFRVSTRLATKEGDEYFKGEKSTANVVIFSIS